MFKKSLCGNYVIRKGQTWSRRRQIIDLLLYIYILKLYFMFQFLDLIINYFDKLILLSNLTDLDILD